MFQNEKEAISRGTIFPISLKTIQEVDGELTGPNLASVAPEEQRIMREMNPFLYGNIIGSAEAIHNASGGESLGEKLARQFLLGAVISHRVCRLEAQHRGSVLATLPQDLVTSVYAKLANEDESNLDLDIIDDVREHLESLGMVSEPVTIRLEEMKRVAAIYRENILLAARSMLEDNQDLSLITDKLRNLEMQGFVMVHSVFKLYYSQG